MFYSSECGGGGWCRGCNYCVNIMFFCEWGEYIKKKEKVNKRDTWSCDEDGHGSQCSIKLQCLSPVPVAIAYLCSLHWIIVLHRQYNHILCAPIKGSVTCDFCDC